MDKEYLIQKWLIGKLSEQEMKAFEQLDDYPELTGILENAKYFKASEFSTIDDFDTFSARLEKNNLPVRKLNWVRPFLRIASIFIVGLLLSYFFLFNKNVAVQTLAGEKTTLELPDASTVIVNALSEISYSKSKWSHKREILLNGEAFFKVAKGARFDVVTAEGTVSVLGTKFNVKRRGKYFEVACFEGVVRVTSNAISKELRKGDNFKLTNGEAFLGKNIYQTPQWTNNLSSFERVPLSEVIAELERQYNISVQIEKTDSERLFTGGFVHDDLENALKSITVPLDLTYSIESSRQVIIRSIKN